MSSIEEIKKIKVLHIISGDLWAGAEAQVYHTLSEIQKRGDTNLYCITFNHGILYNKLVEEGIQASCLDEKNNGSLNLLRGIAKIINRINPHIIHTHSIKEHFLGKLATATTGKVIPMVRTVHGISRAPERLPLKKKIRSELVVLLDELLKKHFSDALIAVSKELESSLKKNRVQGRIYQIYNAIDPYKFVVPDRENIRGEYGARNKFWVGTAARLAEPKNLQMLIMAAKMLAQKQYPIMVSIFGDGPLRIELQALIDAHSLHDFVKLHGFHDNIIPVINALDAFVLCSFHEGLPMVILEAMMLGTPLVCTAVGGMKEIIEDEKTGLLIQSNNITELAKALIKIYEGTVPVGFMTQSAKEMVLDKFTTKKTTEQLLNAYNQQLMLLKN